MPCGLVLLFVLLLSVKAQTVFNSYLIKTLHDYNHEPLHLILQARDADKTIAYLQKYQQKAKFLYSSQNLIRCIIYDTSLLMNMVRNKMIVRAEMFHSKNIHLLNDTMTVRNRILPVKQGVPPLLQSYDGTNVLFGLIDSGIDFSHPDFKYNNGKTRILYIWDQAVTGTISPLPFGYGQEWDSASINSGTCTHSDLTYWGHGTHVAGIAVGNGLSTGTHQGCAPNANIIAVAVDFNSSAPVIADAVQYIISKSNSLNRPVSINASLGDYYGSHDATDLQSQMIISLVSNVPGVIMTGAAGNAGNIKFHTHTICNNSSDTLFTWIKSSSNTMEYWLYADTSDIKNIQISIGATNPSYHYLGNIGFKSYNYSLSTPKYDTLINNNNRIGVIFMSSSINTFGVYELYVKIQADSSQYFWSIESKGFGEHQSWNFDFVSSDLPSSSQYPKIQYYVMPDTISTIVSGFQCSQEIITVGNYVNLKQYYDYNNNLQTTSETAGQLAYHSSAGPTRTGLIKPDITASGNSIFSCIAMGMQSNLINNYPNYLAPGGFHVLGGGTSAASPVVAGLGVLYLQAHPNATNQQFKAAVTNCAYTDIFTGTNLPNNKWGYGKLDGFATFTCSLSLDNQNLNIKEDAEFLFPNPAENQIYISKNISKVIIHDLVGKVMLQRNFYTSSHQYQNNMWTIELSQIPDGIYMAELQTFLGQKQYQKIIICR